MFTDDFFPSPIRVFFTILNIFFNSIDRIIDAFFIYLYLLLDFYTNRSYVFSI